MKTDLCYSTSDCLDTFVMPKSVYIGGSFDNTMRIGLEYHEHRAKIMQDRWQGLTKTYNLLHDRDHESPEIWTLRNLHVEMDRIIADAYGWSDLDLGHGFHETKQGTRFTISESARREVLARLLKLNHERYAEEVAQGLHDKKRGAGSGVRGAKKTGTRGRKGKGTSEPSLFGEED
jgi:hypothetical protein